MPARRDNAPWDAFGGLERLLDHRVRLAICVLLSRSDALTFSRLKMLLDETDGSLGTHLRKLEDDGFLAARKMFHNRKPVTWYRITAAGRKRVRSHLDALVRIIEGEGVPDEH